MCPKREKTEKKTDGAPHENRNCAWRRRNKIRNWMLKWNCTSQPWNRPSGKSRSDFFQSHQYVEIDIFKIHDYSRRRMAVYKATSEGFLVRVLLEPQICFLGGLCQIPRRGSFSKRPDHVPVTSRRAALTAPLDSILPGYLFTCLQPPLRGQTAGMSAGSSGNLV